VKQCGLFAWAVAVGRRVKTGRGAPRADAPNGILRHLDGHPDVCVALYVSLRVSDRPSSFPETKGRSGKTGTDYRVPDYEYE